jgi:hypothetical protein
MLRKVGTVPTACLGGALVASDPVQPISVFDVVAEAAGFFPVNDPALPLPHPTAPCQDFNESFINDDGCGATVNVNACNAIRF